MQFNAKILKIKLVVDIMTYNNNCVKYQTS